MLRNLVERRKGVKRLLKTASGLKLQQYDIQQQALKLTANRFVADTMVILVSLLMKQLVVF